jgi:hypothetical protein
MAQEILLFTKKKMMAQQTAIDWLIEQYVKDGLFLQGVYEQAKAMEKEQRIKDYNAGYVDAQLNHVNDAVNYVYESEYINDKEINK